MASRCMFLDITPLQKSPAFRRLWLGNGLSTFGGYMTMFAVTLQIFTLTHSSLAVGAAGLCVALPSIVFVLLGGSVGDSFDRRRLALLATSGQTVLSGCFAAQAFWHPGLLWLLYGLLLLQSLLTSINAPARRTFMPRLLPKEQIRAGATLNMGFNRLSGVAGPAVAGVLALHWGLATCYAVDMISYFAALYGMAGLPAMPPEGGGGTGPALRAVAEGLRFIARNRFVGGAFLADLSVTILGTPTALFPAVNVAHFGGSAETLGWLMAAPSVGGLLGSILSGPMRHVSREGRAILITSLTWAFAIVSFGLTTILWLGLILLLIAGAADTMLVVFGQTMVQVNTPDRYRGRVSAVDYLVGVGGPQIGDFRAGVVGTLLPPGVGIVVGGLSAAAGALLVSLMIPAFRRYSAAEGRSGTEAGT